MNQVCVDIEHSRCAFILGDDVSIGPNCVLRDVAVAVAALQRTQTRVRGARGDEGHDEDRQREADLQHREAGATRRTAAGTGVRTHWAADLGDFADRDLDVIVCNPPFHRGAAKDSAPTIALFEQAARALADGGEFWCVFNSHLPWKAHLSRLIGATTLVAQNPGFTLTRSLRRREDHGQP